MTAPPSPMARTILATFAARLRHVVRPSADAMRGGLALGRGDAPLHLDWIVGVMAFLAALAVVGALATADAAARWHRQLSGTVTIEIPALDLPGTGAAGTSPEDRLKRVLDTLHAEPGIQSVVPVPRARIAELLSPWLGPGGLPDSLPVPQLVDVTLAPDGRVDLAGLKQRLAAAADGTSVDDHQLWISDLLHLARLAVGLALGILALVALTAVAAVVIATRAALAVHHEAVDLLHLMGAEDNYIADQFASQALRLGLRGGALGLLLAALTLVVFGIASQAVDPKLLPQLWPATDQIVPLLLVPLVTAFLAWATARQTVIGALQKMV